MMSLKNKKIVVTGGAGFLGKWLVRSLKNEKPGKITVPLSKDYDLRNGSSCVKLFKGHDIVIHLAARVGGIGLNQDHPGQLFYDNAMMGLNVLESARKAGVEKVLIVGTACSYPKYCPVPFREEDYWLGELDEVTGVYGMAKKMLLVAAKAYCTEYGLKIVYPILTNLYGPEDHFDPKYGHVIPALITRMVEAKKKHSKNFSVWGSGSATREFLFIEDAANGLIRILKNCESTDPINLGTGQETSIRDLVLLLKNIIGYHGNIVWDPTKPDGQPRRCLDVSKISKETGFVSATTLEEGLRKTVDWYLNQL